MIKKVRLNKYKLQVVFILFVFSNSLQGQNYTKSTVVISPQSSVNIDNKYDNRQYTTNNDYTTNNQNTTNNILIIQVDTTKIEEENPLKNYQNNDEYYIDFLSNGLARVKSNNKFGFVNENGDLIIDYKYEDAKQFVNGLIPVCQNNHWFIIDSLENLVYDLPNATSVNAFNNQFATVFYEKQIALLNISGELSEKFDNIFGFDENGIAKVFKNNKYGLINEKLETILPVRYSYISQFNQYLLAKIKRKNRFGFCDVNGNIIIEPIYKELSCFNNFGYVRFKKKRYGLMDKTGNIVLNNQYWLISDFDDYGYTIVKERPNYSFGEYTFGCITLGYGFIVMQAFTNQQLINRDLEIIARRVKKIDNMKNVYLIKSGFLKYGAISNGKVIIEGKYTKEEALRKLKTGDYND